MVTSRADRLGRLERRFRPRPPDRAEIELLPRWLHFDEITRGQAALAAFGDDPPRALGVSGTGSTPERVRDAW
jgi:hypothetical protein